MGEILGGDLMIAAKYCRMCIVEDLEFNEGEIHKFEVVSVQDCENEPLVGFGHKNHLCLSCGEAH